MAQILEAQGVERTSEIGSLSIVTLAVPIFQQLLRDDLDAVFFQIDGGDFSENQNSIIYTTKGGETYNFPAYFDDPTTSVTPGQDFSARVMRPFLTTSQRNLPDLPQKGEKIEVRGIVYFVEDFEADGFGVLTIYMRLK